MRCNPPPPWGGYCHFLTVPPTAGGHHRALGGFYSRGWQGRGVAALVPVRAAVPMSSPPVKPSRTQTTPIPHPMSSPEKKSLSLANGQINTRMPNVSKAVVTKKRKTSCWNCYYD